MTDTGSSSISLAFVDKGRVIWAESFGLADKENSITATPDTLYCIGSTSKMFAAVATMLLVERWGVSPVSYTHLRAHETVLDLVCRLLLEKKTQQKTKDGKINFITTLHPLITTPHNPHTSRH